MLSQKLKPVGVFPSPLFHWLNLPLPLPGATISGVIPGFNTTVLTNLPRSMLLIQVESVLMGFAFLAMIIVRSDSLEFRLRLKFHTNMLFSTLK